LIPVAAWLTSDDASSHSLRPAANIEATLTVFVIACITRVLGPSVPSWVPSREKRTRHPCQQLLDLHFAKGIRLKVFRLDALA
jgi:hypothetical protein